MKTEAEMIKGWIRRYQDARETKEAYALMKLLNEDKYIPKERFKEILLNYITHTEKALELTFEIMIRQGIDLKLYKSLANGYEAVLNV